VIDVTRRSIEETAAAILALHQARTPAGASENAEK
jgi:regulator of PEP synthase PpsR (kinase-PPPase family)